MTEKHQYTPPVHEEPDAWHRHTPDEGPPQEEHAATTNNAILAVALFVSLLFVFGTGLAAYLYFQVYIDNLRITRMENAHLVADDYLAYRARSDAALGDYRFVNEAAARAGQVTLPLSVAKERIIARYAQQGKN